MGPIAGIAAGSGLAVLLSHLWIGEGVVSIMMIGLLVVAGFFVLKLLFRRIPSTTQHVNTTMHWAGPGGSSMATPPQFGLVKVVAPSSTRIPDAFDSEGFLRIAKLNFVRLQASNGAKSIEDVRELTSPELFAEIKLQMDEHGNAPQQTAVVALKAELSM